ncbi:MAG: hypothetical protein IIC84_07990 [Chloroflexi bacterium]|nr:hypothetical protein [Chloroflexota bacterium]
MDVRVEFERAPDLYEPVEVTVSITPRRPINGPIEAWLSLTSKAVFINGEMSWTGELEVGQTHKFSATIAYVSPAASILTATARYPRSDKVTGVDFAAGNTRTVLVNEEGGEFEVFGVARGEPLAPAPIGSSESISGERVSTGTASSATIQDGRYLLNKAGVPRMIMVQSPAGLEKMRAQGLLPPDSDSRLRGESEPGSVGGLGGRLDWTEEQFADRVLIFLYDRKRPTTGYHLSVINTWAGYGARLLLGEKTVFAIDDPNKPPPGTGRTLMELETTSPRADWPVETRPVSSFVMWFINKTEFGPDGKLDFSLISNGEVLSRFDIVRDSASRDMIVELPLPAIKERVLR